MTDLFFHCTIKFMDFFESDNFNAELIAEEAEHLRRVLACMHEQIELLENDGFAYRIIDMYDIDDIESYESEIQGHDARRRQIRILKKSLSTPYFARMKLVLIGKVESDDMPSMTDTRKLFDYAPIGEDADVYVGANVIFHKDKIIVFSHNSPIGNKVYERFEGGKIRCNGYEYKVVFRRKFDIRGGKLEAVFQDYSEEQGGIVYDKFLAHMLKVKRGDKRLTDIIPTIQANQNAIIVRPADENFVLSGCAGCGKTMLLLQRLEYLSFNKKIEQDNALIIAPSQRYIEHIQPVVDDLMLNSVRRVTMPQLYRELILSLPGIKASERKLLNSQEPVGDEELDGDVVTECYGDKIKRKLISALSGVKQAYKARLSAYSTQLEQYEREQAYGVYAEPTVIKPKKPIVAVDLSKLTFLPYLGKKMTKCKLYLLLTAYCYILGKPDFSSALFVDEGQDYFINEYRLLSECTKATVNIFGDTDQQTVPGRGIDDFDRLNELWDLRHYALNENYRNAREITDYVNDLLGKNVTALGLEGGTVRKLDIKDIAAELKNVGDDRVAVIYSSDDTATAEYLEKTVPKKMLYTVVGSKGLEFERVYACGKLSDKEKYIAYTRALDTLAVCE